MTTVYDLTALTRRADLNRRWVISGFDLPKRQTVTVAAGLVPGFAMSLAPSGRSTPAASSLLPG